MTNNDVLRKVRYVFDYDDAKMISIFMLADHKVTRTKLSDWLKKDDDPAYLKIGDHQLALFLNGLIAEKRGKKEGEPPVAEKRLNNNLIFNKLKIALNLKAEDVIELLELGGITIGKPELSAFFRKPSHKHYRECKDQILRNFLKGMQVRYRDSPYANPNIS